MAIRFRSPVANRLANSGGMANIDMAHDVAVFGGVLVDVRTGEVVGAGTYQYRDPEKRRAYMREYMRRYRGSKLARG